MDLSRDYDEYHGRIFKRIRDFESLMMKWADKENLQSFHLYKLLETYFEIRCKLEDLKLKVMPLKLEVENFWPEQRNKNIFYGECGDKKQVYKEIEFEMAIFDAVKMEAMFELLNEQLDYLQELSAVMFQAEMIKCEIDYIIQEGNFPISQKIGSRTNKPDAQIQDIQTTRLTLSILFSFLRKPTRDQTFTNEVRNWIQQLAALQTQSKAVEDRLFLLFHILRCPNKLSWAVPMIQVPFFNELEEDSINLCLSMLTMIYSPIRKRNDFLIDFTEVPPQGTAKNSDTWIFVGSDGDEADNTYGDYTDIKEDDLIDLLNQIPLENLFRCMLNVAAGHNSVYDFTDQQLLKIIEFNSLMIRLSSLGLNTYGFEHFRNFNKRLGLLIKHCVHYTYDFYTLYLTRNYNNKNVCEKIRMKLDAFLVMACECLFNARSKGVLQFIRCIPFHEMSVRALYAIFYHLNVGFPEILSSVQDYRCLIYNNDFLDMFNAQMLDKSEEDVQFLLQIFFEMAMSRNISSDWDFIKMVSNHVFYVGFINNKTNELYYKPCKDVLQSISNIYPDVISDFICLINSHCSAFQNAKYLFENLPINIWRPNSFSLKVLSTWIMKCPHEKDHLLARGIISRLDWGCNPGNKLFLARDIHMYMACVIKEVFAKNVQDPQAMTVTHKKLIDWCWKLLLRLHLHFLDQPVPGPETILKHRSYYLIHIPDLSEIETLFHGVEENCSMAMYLSLQMTLLGYSIPLICQKGFEIVYKLLTKKETVIVLRCLELITIFFADCPEVLIKCSRFNEIISKLADSTLELFRNMIQSQITRYKDYGFESTMPLVKLWWKSLINLPNPPRKSNMIFLLDSILCSIHNYPEEWSELNNYILSVYTMLPNDFMRKEIRYQYLLYTITLLNIEHELLELKNNLWFEINSILEGDKKMTFEMAFKAATLKCDCKYRRVNELVICKYADIIVNIKHTHYLLPMAVKNFCSIFLSYSMKLWKDHRIKNFCLGIKFNEWNPGLMERVRKQLMAAEMYYKDKCQNFNDSEVASAAMEGNKRLWRFFKECSNQIYNVMTIHEISTELCNEGPACRDMIFSVELNYCHALLDINSVVKQFEDNVKLWSASCYRERTENKLAINQTNVRKDIQPLNRILCYLKSYDEPQKLLDLSSYHITLINAADLSNVRGNAKNYILNLRKNSVILRNLSRELFALNDLCKEISPKLYKRSSITEIHLVRCSTGLTSALYSCSKPARVKVKIETTSVNKKVREEINANRNTYNKILTNVHSELLLETVETIRNLSGVVKHLTTTYNKYLDEVEKNLRFTDLCIAIFFELAESCDEKISSYPPAMEIMRRLIISFGICIQNSMKYEGIRLIQLSFKCEAISNELCAFVKPLETNFDYYLKMYEIVIQSKVQLCNMKTILALLPKFDMQSCIRIFIPNANDSRRLMRSVFTALEKLNTEECVMTLYRRQLIQIFEFEFPRFYTEIIKILLASCSQKKIKPIIIRDIINSFFGKDVNVEISNDIYDTIEENIENKNSFNLNSILETLSFFAAHFQEERMKNGMLGMYSAYEDYCEFLSILFCCIGHQTLSTLKKSFSLNSEELCRSRVLVPLFMMYNPWICIYQYSVNSSNIVIDKIQGGTPIYTWSESCLEYIKMFLQSLASIIKYSASIQAISNISMSYTFHWFVSIVRNYKIPSRFRDIIYNSMNSLPWHCYYPCTRELETIYQISVGCDQENILLLTNVFYKIAWMEWIPVIFANSNIISQDKAMYCLLYIYLKIFLKTNFLQSIPEQKFTSALLSLPWHRVSYSCMEEVFSQINHENPLSVLKLFSKQSELDFSIDSLLKKTCAINHEDTSNSFNIRAKRLLYVREMITLARKNIDEAETSSEEQVNRNNLKSFLLNLMETVGRLVKRIIVDLEETNNEAVYLLFEMINAFSDQSNFISSFFMNLLITWQAKHTQNENVLLVFFEAISMKRLFASEDYHLLESTIDHFFKNIGTATGSEANGWIVALEKLNKCFEYMDATVVMQGNHLHVAHLLLNYNLENGDDCQKYSFISKMTDLLKVKQISEELEPKLAILWGGIIGGVVNCCASNEQSYQQLLLMAETLLSIAQIAESWSNKLLGIVGAQYSSASQKFIFLSKLLASLVYLFCNRRDSYLKIVQEFKSNLNQKGKFEMNKLAIECIQITEENKDFRPEIIVSQIFSLIHVYYHTPVVLAAKELWQKQFR